MFTGSDLKKGAESKVSHEGRKDEVHLSQVVDQNEHRPVAGEGDETLRFFELLSFEPHPGKPHLVFFGFAALSHQHQTGFGLFIHVL